MSFDPYHVWLGIPPNKRPVTYYALLGLSDSECDPNVIRNAVERSLEHIGKKKEEDPEHTAEAEKIQRWIREAGEHLSDPIKKKQYDAHLADRSFWRYVKASQRNPASQIGNSSLGSYRAKSMVGLISLAAFLFLGLTALGVWAWLSVFHSKPATPTVAASSIIEKHPDHKGDSAETNEAKLPAIQHQEHRAAKPEPARKPQPEPAKPAAKPVAKPAPEDAKKAKPDAKSGDKEKDTGKKAKDGDQETKDPASPAGKKPVPSAEVKEKLLAELRDDPILPKEKRKAARQLYADSRTTEDPAKQWVQLFEAHRLAAAAEDLDASLAILDAMEPFDLPPNLLVQKRLDEVKSTLLTAAKAEDRKRAMTYVLSVVRDAYAHDQYGPLLQFAVEISRFLVHESAMREVKDLVAQARRVKRVYDELAPEGQSIKDKWDDPGSCQKMGEFACFEKGDWQQGIPYLAKGSNLILRGLAAQMQQGPTEAAELYKIGKGWLQLVRNQTDPRYDKAFLDAAYTYFQRAKVHAEDAEIFEAGRALSLQEMRTGRKWINYNPLAPARAPLFRTCDVFKASEPLANNRALNRVRGVWTMGTYTVPGQTLHGLLAEENSCLFIPCASTGSFEVRMKLHRLKGTDPVNISFPVGAKQMSLVFDQGGKNGKSGLVQSGDPKNPAPLFGDTRKVSLAEAGTLDVTIQVRQQGELASVQVFCDGRLFVEWSGKWDKVSPGGQHGLAAKDELASKPGIVLTTHRCQIVFSDLVREEPVLLESESP